MRRSFSPAIEAGRVKVGFYGTELCDPDAGLFDVRAPSGEMLRVIMSTGKDWHMTGMPLPAWEHVSVSHVRRCPTWEEMAWIKSAFWGDEECVMQFHPPKSDYVNFHPHCLHLWKPIGIEFPRPSSEAVGPRSAVTA